MCAQLRYYMHINPEDLSEEEVFRYHQELLYVRKLEKEESTK
jgi:hypothetical protein